MADYPGGVKTFAAINDGDTVADEMWEDISAEVVAVEDALLNGFEHDLIPQSTGDARKLGGASNFWGLAYLKGVALTAASELTIASGVVTATQGVHTLDTESDAATDDLDTITPGTGLVNGSLLLLRAENVARVVTLKDGSGNLLLNGDYALSATDRQILLSYDGTNWREVSRSVPTTSAGFTPAYAQVTNSSTQSATQNTTTVITFNTEDLDTNTFHDTGSNTSRLTIPTALDGTYRVWARLPVSTAAPTTARIQINKNGSVVARATTSLGSTSTALFIEHTLALVATDYVEVVITEVDNVNALTIGSATAHDASRFGLIRVA